MRKTTPYALWVLLAATCACDDTMLESEPVDALADVDPYADAGPDTPDDDVPDSDVPDSELPDAEPTPAPIEWSVCPLLSEPPQGMPEGTAECALVPMPLDWLAPDGRTVDVWVKRLRAPIEAHAQLWLLQGGPGGSAVVFERSMADYAQRFPGHDIYITDARGAGRSSRWSCPDGEDPASEGGSGLTADEIIACRDTLAEEWGSDGMAQFNTTAAARDVLDLINRTAAPAQRVVVYGVSYGTFWLNRILQLAPDRLGGAIFDGVVPADDPNLQAIDAWHHRVGEKLMGACAEDAICAERLGDDPWAEVGALLDDLDAGHCAALFAPGTSRLVARRLMGAMLSSLLLRSMIPAVVYRLRRCEEGDLEAIAHLFELLFPDTEPSPNQRLFSVMLSMHVTFSELWGEPRLDADALAAQAEAAWMSKDLGLTFGPWAADWPVYDTDEFHGRWAETDIPILLMNGTFDPQTPIETAQAAADAFDGMYQTFVTMPDVTHGTVGQSSVAGNGPTCAVQLMTQFLADPTAALDLGCLDTLQQRVFDFPANYAGFIFGTDDLWDNPPLR